MVAAEILKLGLHLLRIKPSEHRKSDQARIFRKKVRTRSGVGCPM
jgi:hypothetical protein